MMQTRGNNWITWDYCVLFTRDEFSDSTNCSARFVLTRENTGITTRFGAEFALSNRMQFSRIANMINFRFSIPNISIYVCVHVYVYNGKTMTICVLRDLELRVRKRRIIARINGDRVTLMASDWNLRENCTLHGCYLRERRVTTQQWSLIKKKVEKSSIAVAWYLRHRCFISLRKK